jgi:type II secretory pathway predicted ATPase ExeA
MKIPSEESMQRRVRAFMQTSGMTGPEFAQAIGYAHCSLNHFLNGRYCENQGVDEKHTRAIRAAAGEFMDLHHVSLEWSTPHAAHRTASFRAVRNAALNAMRSGSAYLVDGPPGTEKTFSLRSVEREINDGIEGRAVYVYARAEHRPQSFLRECCLSAGIPANGYIDDLLRKLRFFLGARNKRVVLLVDEAQHLDHAGLEVLRQLLDLPPFFGVILSGSHDLTQRLAHWQMEQWRSRLRKTLYLNGPTQAEARQILRAELGEIDDQACDETIAECQASAQRIETVHGKTVSKSFSYTSARDLFGAIERTRELMAQSTQKAGAA